MPQIVLIEDNDDDIELTRHSLAKVNLDQDLVVLRDGQAALDYFLADPPVDLPKVILLDLKLPKVEGLEVLAQLRQSERTRSVPIVVMTTSDQEDDVGNSYRLGANSFVRKPIRLTELTDAVQRVGTYWTQTNYAPNRS